jgi:phytoene dehydrogenase-like protein
MMQNHHDTIIIGAGHNGLVAAAYLAKRGENVLVLERRGIVGGSLVTESFGDGFTVDSVQTGGTLRPDIVKDLKLAQYGWAPSTEKQVFITLLDASHAASVTYGDHLVIDADPIKAVESIKRFSATDADAGRIPPLYG